MSYSLQPDIIFSGDEWRSGLAWTLVFCVMIGGSAKNLVAVRFTAILNYKTLPELSLVLSPIVDFASESKDKLQPIS